MNKIDLSTAQQKWRLAVVLLMVLTVITMVIPGSHTQCNYGDELHPYRAEHDPSNYISGGWIVLPQFSLAMAIIAAALAFLSLKANNNVFLWFEVPCAGISLWLMTLAGGLSEAAECIRKGHSVLWFPFVPPVLLVLSMISAVVAWFVRRKEV